MAYAGVTPTKFGRIAQAQSLRPERMHIAVTAPLKETDFEPPIPVLDQEDLIRQGIHVSAFIRGAKDVDALGSCTCNSGVAHYAERFAAAHGKVDLAGAGISTTDSAANEVVAITWYHGVTDQTGNPATEWPPTDCGSNGFSVCRWLEAQKRATSFRSAANIPALASLLQSGSVMMGLPWFRAWMEPDSHGFVDGDGSDGALMSALASGVAGGHETTPSALERLVVSETGQIDLQASHIRVRNSWGSSFGDNGSYRVHLSTLAMLGSYCDFKQVVL